MKIGVDEFKHIVITEAYSGVMLETSEGNQIGICMRDDTFEINILPKKQHTNNWWRVNMQTGKIASIIPDRDLLDGPCNIPDCDICGDPDFSG
ncbi:MAG: hypothetical protein HKM92_02770 [Arenibacter sp.]|nr:hypothetical protein [Arenibacter sp.]